MANNEEWVRRVTSLNQWRRAGERAPHKPLLLLYALGRLQRTGSSAVAFVDAEADLRRLLEEFGPPRSTSPGYPFHHLVSDGLWVVRTHNGVGSPGSNLGPLRAGAVGALSSDFARALEQDPELLASVVRAILDANFPATLHGDILASIGIDVESTELEAMTSAGTPVRRRDPTFRPAVLLAYEFRCAICGYDGQILRESVGIEAAHIRWWAASGPDEIANAVALCSLHHKLLDRGVIGFTTELTVAISSQFIGRSASAESLVLSFAGRPLLGPQAGHSQPDPKYVAWHSREVFRYPARQPTSS